MNNKSHLLVKATINISDDDVENNGSTVTMNKYIHSWKKWKSSHQYIAEMWESWCLDSTHSHTKVVVSS